MITRDIACPNCQRKLRVPEIVARTEFKCPVCDTVFTQEPEPVAETGIVAAGPEASRQALPPPTLGDPLDLPHEPVGGVELPVPKYALSPAKHVGWATFLGGPTAGCFVLALNFFSVGQSLFAVLTALAGIGTLVALLFLQLPLGVNFFVSLVSIAVMYAITKWLFEDRYFEHLRRGGRTRNLGIVLLCIVVPYVFIFGGVYLFEYLNEPGMLKVAAGPHQNVYYPPDGSAEEAKRLGEFLFREGYFAEDHTADVVLVVSATECTISFVLAPDTWDQPRTIAYFQGLAERIHDELYPTRKVTIALCDQNMVVHRRVP